MNKIISEELSRMKSLFGYERGRVISEQATTPKQQEALNAGWGPVSDEYAKSLPVDQNGKIIPKNVGEDKQQKDQLAQMDADYLKSPVSGKPDANHGLRQCHSNYHGPCNVIWDGYIHNYVSEDMWVKKFGKVPPMVNGKDNSSTISNKPKFVVPTQLKGGDGVKRFQDWMDQNHPNWVNGKNLNKGGGYGKFGPSTNAAWNKYKNEYLTSLVTLPTPQGQSGDTGGLGVPTPDGGETMTDNENPYLQYSDRG